MRPSLTYNLGCLFRLGAGTLLAIAVIALVRHFVFDIMPISGLSMYPAFDDRDVVVFNKISYVVGEPKRGDSVVLRFPGDPQNERYIKRIVGLPGETVTIGENKIFVNSEELVETYIPEGTIVEPNIIVVLGDDEYYLIGDNRPVSSDSRVWGTARKSNFIGKAFFILLPASRFQAIPEPAY